MPVLCDWQDSCMALIRDHPYERSYFLVELGTGSKPSPFRSVDLPVATTEVVASRSGDDKALEPEKRPGLVGYTNLVLTRGLTGETDLFDWWEQVRAGEREVHRDVTVSLLDEAHDTVWTWRFTFAFPTVYRFSQLDADSSELVDEVLELAFTRMSIV